MLAVELGAHIVTPATRDQPSIKELACGSGHAGHLEQFTDKQGLPANCARKHTIGWMCAIFVISRRSKGFICAPTSLHLSQFAGVKVISSRTRQHAEDNFKRIQKPPVGAGGGLDRT